MARRDWDSLSDAYRARLERSGVGRADYEAGVNLQSARGQRREATETARRREEGLPALSVVRRWRARARALGVDRPAFDDALESEGWLTTRDAVIAKERLHGYYVASGQPSGNARRVLRGEGLYDPPPDWQDILSFMSANYGSVWGYYH